MNLLKHALNTLFAGLILIPALAVAEKPVVELCPCWGIENGMEDALDAIDHEVGLLKVVSYDRSPEDYKTELEISEYVYPPPPDPAPADETQQIWVEVFWIPEQDKYKCAVTIYDYYTTTPWLPGVDEPIETLTQLKACFTGAKLIRLKAAEYNDVSGNH